MKYFIRLLHAIIFILAASSCHDDINLSHIGCCDTQNSYNSIGNATVYLPNVFTPNEDGSNDRYFVRGDSIRRIINFEIRDKLDKVVHQVKDINYSEYENGWDGKVNGVVEKGLYSLYLTIEANNGFIGSVEGRVCNFPCGLDGVDEKIPTEGCHFDMQWKCWLYDDGCLILEYSDCFE